jgi:hypothetical protein
MPSLHLLTISAQLRLRLLSTRFLSGTDLRTCGLNVTDLRTCELNAGKTLRERDEPLAAVSTFNRCGRLMLFRDVKKHTIFYVFVYYGNSRRPSSLST